MKSVRQRAQAVKDTVLTFLKWILLASLTGAAGGLVGSLFHLSVGTVTALRHANGWLLWLLPLLSLL